ncbi:hypothetical protein NQ314_000676 [Rhamnusium bicolor]|uniref:PiggyBac transposable element-derived protein domain-containing protein n=1 Tax=Rhamnusium bicolor TaxID=1586634 RepID=A0AAV8ZTV0_9CUCU|nr:hypothetical protein NQ314_000676 [Rhamnusium bicolor]
MLCFEDVFVLSGEANQVCNFSNKILLKSVDAPENLIPTKVVASFVNKKRVRPLTDEIPSDCESEESDSIDEQGDDVNSIFDIETMSIDMLGDEGIVEQNQNGLDATTAEESDGWEMEDEMTLSLLQAQIKRLTTTWTNDATFCTKPAPFVQQTGPTIPADKEDPTDILIHLFTNELIETIVFKTNLYALQKSGGNANAFVATTCSEIKNFLGLNILMGMKSVPSYRDYWSSRIELRDSYISSSMSRDRFGWLLKTFLNSFAPNEHQAIDESMIRYKGRSSIRQFMPMKPVKRGYKVWMRCDQTGYVLQFQIYTGKIRNLTEKSLAERVVKDLSRNLVGKNHKLYFDNFFNSVPLQKDLLADKIYACGTARKNHYRVSTDGLIALKWMDRKAILFISNFHDPTKLETVSRRQKDGSREEITCLSLINDYNRHMGYVDKFDMLKSLYEIDRKSRKWWHRIFWFFLDATVVNSYIIFKSRLTNNMTLKQFRLSVVSGLIGADSETQAWSKKY